jgi:hypothetical protein
MPATFLTWNPAHFEIAEKEWADEAKQTRSGRPVPGSWSVARVKNIPVGRRVFLVRQGSGPRGIVAAGTTRSRPYEDQHWDGSERAGNYVDVEWDAHVMDPSLPLALASLLDGVPGVAWNSLFGSGTSTFDDGALARVEELWARRLADDDHPVTTRRFARAGQAWESDAVVRRAVEDYAQGLMSKHFESDGWVVEDTRVGRPYDAIATRRDDVIYLEAKGTRGDGSSVLVTEGEVNWARGHKGQCFIGVVSGIRLEARKIVPGSGVLTVREWNPKPKELTPTAHRWTPRA